MACEKDLLPAKMHCSLVVAPTLHAEAAALLRMAVSGYHACCRRRFGSTPAQAGEDGAAQTVLGLRFRLDPT
jgi:hypothetical protein